MAKFEEQLLTRVDLGISQFSASGCQEFGGGGGQREAVNPSQFLFSEKRAHTTSPHSSDILYTLF